MSDNYRSLIHPSTLPYVDNLHITGGMIDDHGLILPQITPTLESKIATDINDVHHRILLHASQGKHILYLPGCYDLVHVGHASYIQQVIAQYLKLHDDLGRENLYVLLLADSDELIEATKGAASRGKVMRPLQTHDMLSSLAIDFSGHNPRLYDLACLDVDCVGMTPSPTDLGALLKTGAFREWFNTYSAQEIDLSDVDVATPVGKHIFEGVMGYCNMVKRLKDGQFAEVGIDFHRARKDPTYNPSQGKWNIASWQTFIHTFLGTGSLHNPCIRIISEHDIDYKDIVAGLMKKVGISHAMIDDVEVISTTALERTYGWQELIQIKLDHYFAIRPSL